MRINVLYTQIENYALETFALCSDHAIVCQLSV